MKDKFAIGTALIFASAAPVFAQYGNDSSSTMHESTQQHESSCGCSSNCGCCNECCPAKDPCAKCAQLWPSDGPDWIITPGAGPCTADGCDFFITAEFIYWAVRQDHMHFAYTQPTATNPEPKGGELFHPKWRVEPGFKVGIGWLSDCDGWDFYLNYTWLRPRTGTRTVTPGDGEQLLDFFSAFNNFLSGNTNIVQGAPPPTVQSMKGKWDLDFNVLDLEWGRNFYISKCLYLRPHFGLKGTWQCSDLRVSGIATSQIGSTANIETIFADGKHSQDYWGIGPRAGLDTAWHFNKCFSIVGEVAATALWGKFSSKSDAIQTNDQNDLVVFTPNTNIKTNFHSVKPVLEFFLGLRWEDWWCCDEYYGAIDLGWEVQWWGGQNQIVSGVTETRWGDLGLQGLTLRFRFQF